MFDHIEPCLYKYCCKDEDDTYNKPTSELKVEEILCEKVTSDSGHEKWEYESNTKWHTIGELFDIIATSLLPNITIIISLITNGGLRVGTIDSKIMFIFQLLHGS